MQSVLLANTILIVHALYVGIVILSVPLILIGGWLKWDWVHNAYFRIIHLLMIGVVVAESLLGINCPLTVWETAARAKVAQINTEQDFVAIWLDRLLFYHFSHNTFTIIYVGFGLLVLSLFILIPIRWQRRSH